MAVMNFDQKLNVLMHLFKLSNSKLARGISVDASLVSRWLSGERKISPNSPHIPKMASYFLKLNAYHYQKEYLERIIAARISDSQIHDDAERVHILADWLISGDKPDPQPEQQPEQLLQSTSMISSLSEILSGKEQKFEDPITAPPILPGVQQTCEIFEGRDGRRQAVLNILSQVVQSQQKLNLYMTSEDDARWMTEAPDFAAKFANLLHQVIKNGHQITLIHMLSKKVNEIMNMMLNWIPLHMIGHVNSYYFPRFNDRRIRQTYLIVQGKTALTSSTIADFSGNDLTYCFSDAASVDQNLRLFMVHLSQCRPLFSLYNKLNMKTYYDQISELIKKPGTVYNLRHQLNTNLLPAAILPSYIPDPVQSDLLKLQQKEFFGHLAQDRHIDILPLSLLEQLADGKPCYLAGDDVFADYPISLSSSETVLWLQKTADALRRYPNYELYLSSEASEIDRLPVNINYKEGVMAGFSRADLSAAPSLQIVLSENNVLHSLSYYMENVIQKIPIGLRSKNEVLDKLGRLISEMSV